MELCAKLNKTSKVVQEIQYQQQQKKTLKLFYKFCNLRNLFFEQKCPFCTVSEFTGVGLAGEDRCTEEQTEGHCKTKQKCWAIKYIFFCGFCSLDHLQEVGF